MRETRHVNADPARVRSVILFYGTDEFEDGRALHAPEDGHAVDLPDHDAIARCAPRRFADDDRGAVEFVGALQAAGDVRDVPDSRVVEPSHRAYVADERVAAVQTDANSQRLAGVVLNAAFRSGAQGGEGVEEFWSIRPPDWFLS
jgi:hypothetical protein